MARRGREPVVAREQCGTKGFGEHDVCGVVGRKVVAVLPDAGQQDEVRIAGDREIPEVADASSPRSDWTLPSRASRRKTWATSRSRR